MMIRVYQKLSGGARDAGQDDALLQEEEAMLSTISRLYIRELFAFRQQMTESFPDAVLKIEQAFRSEAMYLSFTLSFSEGEKLHTIALLEQMEASGRIAAWEDCEQEKHPSLRTHCPERYEGMFFSELLARCTITMCVFCLKRSRTFVCRGSMPPLVTSLFPRRKCMGS